MTTQVVTNWKKEWFEIEDATYLNTAAHTVMPRVSMRAVEHALEAKKFPHRVGESVWFEAPGIEEANGIDIREIHLLQIQSYSWSAALDLRFHLIKVLRSKRPAQPNPRSALPGSPFNLQSHGPLVRKHTVAKCNNGAIHNSLHGHDLEVPAILNFEEFLFGEENAAD